MQVAVSVITRCKKTTRDSPTEYLFCAASYFMETTRGDISETIVTRIARLCN